MLPPLQILAQGKATLAAELPAGTLDQGAQGGFENSLAAFLHQPAALSGNRLRPEALSGGGYGLPPGGKELPLAVPLPTAMPELAGRVPEVSGPPVAAGETAAIRKPPETASAASTMLPGALSLAAGRRRLPDTATLEQAIKLPSSPRPATMPRLPAEGVPLAPLPTAPALRPVSTETLPASTAVTGTMSRLGLPGGHIPTLPGKDARLHPVSVARRADAMPVDAAELRMAQQGASLAAPAAVLRDPLSDPARTPLQDALLQAEFVDRKPTLTGTAPPPAPAPAPISHASPANVSTAAAPAAPPLQLLNPIDLPPGANGWSDSLGDRVVMMAGNKIQNAEIRLNPAELGPLRVQISVDDGTASVNFHAQHPLTRDAIEQALPRLREMLSDQGLSLGDTNVSDHGVPHDQAEPDRHAKPSEMIAGDGSSVAIDAENMARPMTPLAAAGIVDLFA